MFTCTLYPAVTILLVRFHIYVWDNMWGVHRWPLWSILRERTLVDLIISKNTLSHKYQGRSLTNVVNAHNAPGWSNVYASQCTQVEKRTRS